MKRSKGPTDYEILAVARLKQNGFRVTMPRIQVIRTLDDSVTALSAYGVHERIIAEGGRIDVVSVYRILATLVDLGLAHHIGIVDGYLACRMEYEHHLQSEHAVCQSCGSVHELDVPDAAIIAARDQLKLLGFTATSFKVEILGNCKSCTVRA